jgi:Holliday junction resolvase RusA-like endonuclease
MKIVVGAIPPSLNRFSGRKNIWEYRQLKSEWKRAISVLAKKIKHETFKKATVTITYYFPTRSRRDPDNYSGKMILDGLTCAGVIADDSFSCIELRICGEYDKRNPRTEIVIDKR